MQLKNLLLYQGRIKPSEVRIGAGLIGDELLLNITHSLKKEKINFKRMVFKKKLPGISKEKMETFSIPHPMIKTVGNKNGIIAWFADNIFAYTLLTVLYYLQKPFSFAIRIPSKDCYFCHYPEK